MKGRDWAYLKWLVPTISLLGAAGLVWFAIVLNRPTSGGQDGIYFLPNQKDHPVTRKMNQETAAKALRTAPAFTAPGTDGKEYALEDLHRGKPVFLIFVKDGCPCSVNAQPLFNQLRSAYRSDIGFAAVIDADRTGVKDWTVMLNADYPVLLDKGKKIISSYGATNGVFSALLTKEGKIDHMWPGYSKEILTQMGKEIARLTGVREKQLDLTNAPTVPLSGCPYQPENPKL